MHDPCEDMFGDPWPEEPADPFPEYGEPDIDDLSDRVASSDLSPDIQRGFLGLIAIFNIGLFALALGPMMMLFQGDWYYGGLIAGIGAVTCAYGIQRYYVYRRMIHEV